MLRKIIAYITILDGENDYEETRPCERTSPITSESEEEEAIPPTPPPPPSIRDIIIQTNTEEAKPSTSGVQNAVNNINEGASTSGKQPVVDEIPIVKEESATPTSTAIHLMQPRVLLHDFNQLILNDNDSDETQYESAR